ncbi:MAG: beta strand repeat-containing protein [Candidatus Dormibacteria bacterium]
MRMLTNPRGSWTRYRGSVRLPRLGFGLVATAGLLALGLAAIGPVSAHVTRVTNTTSSTGGSYVSVTPTRIADTRANSGYGYAGQTLATGTTLQVQVPTSVVPAGASGVVLNVTAVDPSAAGFVSVFPGGATVPTGSSLVSNLNFAAGATVANLVTVGLSSTGTVEVYNYTGNTNVVIDVEGYYTSTPASNGSGLYNAISPTRVLGSLASGAAIAANTATAVTVAGGSTGVPASATAVVVNVTAADATAASFVTAFPAGVTMPVASNLNFAAQVPNQAIANRVTVGVGTGGQIMVYNHAGSVNVDVDVNGYYTGSGGTGSAFVAITPQRLTDTRSSTNGSPIAASTSETFSLTNSSIPANAAAVAANFTVVPGAAPGYATVYPTSDTTAPVASDVNWTASESPAVPNYTIADTAGTGKVAVFNSHGATINLLIDAFGYFTPSTTPTVYAVTPSAVQNVTVSTSGTGTATDTQGDIQYTASGLGTTPVDIALFSSANVTDTNGAYTFTASGGNAAQGTVAGKITVVNGTPQNSSQVNTVTPINGSVTFTVNSTTVESDYPVVFADNTTHTLPVNSSGAPTASYGVGGEANWNAAAATAGTYTGEVVTSVNSSNSSFQADAGSPTGAYTFTYGQAGSTYNYDVSTSSSGYYAISEAQFASYLSAGDVINLVYNPSGPSTFTMTKDVPAAPTALTASYSATATTPGVQLAWTAPVNPDVASYTVLRATVSSTGVVGTYSSIATGVTGTTYVDAAATTGTYSYEVEAVGSGTNGTSGASNAAQATVPAAAFAALPSAPVSLGTTLTPATTTGNVSTGDVIQTTFNQPLNSPVAGASVTLSNTAGTDVGVLTNGTNATFAVGGANSNVLTITVTASPTFTTGSVLAYPAKYTSSTGITGVATSSGAGGFGWDLAAADGAGPAVQGIVTVPGSGTPNAPRAITAYTNTTATTTVTGAAGSALPGATITVTDTAPSGTTGTAVAAANGSWTVTLSHVPTTGSTLSATETILQEGTGNGVSAATTFTAL